MTTRDIQTHLEEIYGVEVPPTLISQVTHAVTEEVRLWQDRPLDEIYPIVYLDAVRIKVRHNGQIVNKAVYLAIAITMQGIKDVLSEAAYPQTQVQLCIVHLVRRSLNFAYPSQIRRAIYTTNTIESLNMSLKKVTNISKKWTIPIKDWKSALNQFSIMFEEKLPNF
jgi:transposase-like protein